MPRRRHLPRPETFVLDTSRHDDEGDAVEFGFALDFRPVTIDASASRFDADRYGVFVRYRP